MAVALTPAQWAAYDEDGFVVVDNLVPEADLSALNARLDDIMMGRVQYGDALLMQLDPSAKAVGSGTADEYAAYSAAGAERGQTPGFKGPSLAYRKIGEAQAGLECDPVFLEFMRRPFFRSLCDRVYGAHAAIAVYRAMVMSKPAGGDGGGTPLPWREYPPCTEGVRATLTAPPLPLPRPCPRPCRPGRRRLVGARQRPARIRLGRALGRDARERGRAGQCRGTLGLHPTPPAARCVRTVPLICSP